MCEREREEARLRFLRCLNLMDDIPPVAVAGGPGCATTAPSMQASGSCKALDDTRTFSGVH